MNPEKMDEILCRWSPYAGMGERRSAADYTDAGCRTLATQAFMDVALLIAELHRLQAEVRRLGDQADFWANR